MKTDSQSQTLRQREKYLSRFNPIRGLTPEKLSRLLDDFHSGEFCDIARLFDLIEKRDDTLACVAPKRKKAVARREFEIIKIEETPEAERHAQALEYFYNNLTASHAVDIHERGGFALLVRQMMDSVGKKYAVHEIVWQQSGPGQVTAQFLFVPLWYFHARAGELRFISKLGDHEGAELPPGEWLITIGDGLMESSSVCYMFKRLPLGDWLTYCERCGMPGIGVTTTAAPNTPEWDLARQAARDFGAEFAGVFSQGTVLEPIDLSTKGELPYPPLVERMDRKLAAIWRGGDLSSMSAGAGQGQGASVQDDESELIEQDDAAQLTGALNAQVDPFVIRYALGADKPLAYVKILVPAKQNIDQDLKVDDKLVAWGVPLSRAGAAERYGRQLAQDDEELLGAAAAEPAATANAAPTPAEMARFITAAREQLGAALADDLGPIFARLAATADLPTVEAQRQALENLRSELPAQLKAILARSPGAAEALENIFGTALVNGLAGTRKPKNPNLPTARRNPTAPSSGQVSSQNRI